MTPRTTQPRTFSLEDRGDGSLRLVAGGDALAQLAVALADARANGVAVVPMTEDRELIIRRDDGDD